MDGEQCLIGAYRGPQESELGSYVSSPGPAITPGQHQTTKSIARAPPKRVALRGDDGTSEEDSPYVPSFRKPRAVHTLTREETAWSNVLFEKMGICGEDMDDDDDTEDSEEDKEEPIATKMTIIDNTAAMPMPSISEAVDEKAIVLLEAELSAAKEETAAISALLEISSKQKALLEEKLRHAEEQCQQIRRSLDDKTMELTTAGAGTGGHPDVAIKIELLNRQVSQLQASGERAEAARGVLAAQNAELKDQLCHLEAQLVVAKALAAAATQFTDTGGENAQEIAELKNSILQLKKELVGLQTAVHAADKTAIAAEARAANAMVREQDAHERFSDAQGEKEAIEQAYTDAVLSAEQLELELAQLRTEMSELQGEISRLQNAADSSAAAHGAEIAVLKARLNATEAELQIVRQSYHDAQGAQTHLTEEISVLKEQVDSLSVANADIIMDKEAAEARALSAERREQEALQAASDVHEAKEAADHAYTEAVQTIDQLKYDSAQLVTEVSELQTQITGLQAEISLLQGSASETAAAHGGEIAILEGKLSTAEAKLNSAEAELHSVRHSCQIAEQASAQFAEEISVLTTKLADVIAVNTELQAEREALDVRATNAEAREQQALEAASAAEQAYADAMQTVEQMKEQSAELRTEVAVLYGQIEGLQDENLQLQSASAEIATAHEAEVGKLEGKLSITAAQLQHAETELQTLRQQFDLAKQAQVRLTEEIAVLKGDLSASIAANALTTAERDTAQSHLTAAKTELETLKQQTAAYEQELKSEVASLEDHLAIAHDTASTKEAELETEKAAGRAAVDALQKQRHEEVHALTLQLDSVQEQLNYKNAEHAALNDKIQAVEAAAAQAASQHAALLLEAQKQRQEAEFNCAAARQQAAVAAAAIPLPPRSPPRTTFPMPVHALPQSTHASVWSRLVERKRSVDSSQLRDIEAGVDDFDADATDSASHDGDERGPLAALMMRLGAWQSAVRVAKVGDGVAAAVRARYYQQQRAIMLLAAVYLVVLHIVLVTGRLRSI